MQPILVPLVRQAYDYSCGAACLASCLYYWGVWDGRETELYPLLNTTHEGTKGNNILLVAKQYGLKQVGYKTDMTVEQLKILAMQGFTIILNIQAWGTSYSENQDWSQVWEDGHYVVLVAVQSDYVVLMDPAIPGQYGRMSINELRARWHDWSDDGTTQEYHTAILLKGEQPIDRQALIPIK